MTCESEVNGSKEMKCVKNGRGKSEKRTEGSSRFQTRLNKVEELKQAALKGSEERKKMEGGGRKRPKSAGAIDTRLPKKDWKRRPRSSETRTRGEQERKNFFRDRKYQGWWHRSSSSVGESLSYSDLFAWQQISPRSRSKPDCSKGSFDDWQGNLWKVKRSLRLLGFRLSDFGVYSREEERTLRRRPRRPPATCATRTVSRSVSLSSLRETVRRAWTDNRLDRSHRRLLAQAAYEEWYFKKEEGLWRKREEEKLRKVKERKSSQKDLERKRAKAQEEFDKWLKRKRGKRKDEENPGKSLIKSREEVERAFVKWKRGKDRELKKQRKEKKEEEEKKAESEKQKKEKKEVAEKAFQQWKSKVEETKKKERQKRLRRKEIQEEVKKIKKQTENSKISFQVWKDIKDEQLRQKMNGIREAARREKKKRLIQMEERMYEAEQAFQDWLEKVDLRKQKRSWGTSSLQENLPWLPI